MELMIKNTLTQKKESFIPLKEKDVKIYVCGITLYDDIHIGHLKSIVAFEVMRNYFKKLGYNVTYVRNITDVDDKIIAKAIKEGTDPLSLVEFYIKKFHDIMSVMGINPPDVEPRVTNYLDSIKAYIQDLIDNGSAYIEKDGVYFDTQKNKPERYELSKQVLDDLEKESRIDSSNYSKRNKADFALWKQDEVYGYESDLIEKQGRPGWHIECSVMHHHTLGEKFDIHGGGRDLIFPHHENEILQSRAHNGHNPANYWIHNGMMTKDGKKLSKSLGNSIFLKDLLGEFSPEAIKWFLNKGQYDQSQEYLYDEMISAEKAWSGFLILIHDLEKENDSETSVVENVMIALSDNFNTPVALSYIYNEIKLLREDKSLFRAEQTLKAMKILSIIKDSETIETLKLRAVSHSVPSEIIELAEKRRQAKGNKDFALSDKIREEIRESGWSIVDTKDGYSIEKVGSA